ANQAVEHRVVEDLPPLAQVVWSATEAFVPGVDPVLGHGRGRFVVVGTDLEAVVNVFAERGAAAQGQRQNHEQETDHRSQPNTDLVECAPGHDETVRRRLDFIPATDLAPGNIPARRDMLNKLPYRHFRHDPLRLIPGATQPRSTTLQDTRRSLEEERMSL